MFSLNNLNHKPSSGNLVCAKKKIRRRCKGVDSESCGVCRWEGLRVLNVVTRVVLSGLSCLRVSNLFYFTECGILLRRIKLINTPESFMSLLKC